ncbi:MAG: peptidase T [Exilispira sp.]
MNFPELLNRFCKYVRFDTRSNPESTSYPSTEKQLVFLNYLKEELLSIGLNDVKLDQYGYLMAKLDSNIKNNSKNKVDNIDNDNNQSSIVFIAHVDTSVEESGENVKPQIIKNYTGDDIKFPDDEKLYLSIKNFPVLTEKIGKTIITASGKTLLGADDKAGIAEIVTAFEYLKRNPEIEHPDIYLLFTPDEEVGNGTKYLKRENIPAKYGYTVDGGAIGEIENENFNAVNGEVIIHGFNTHPGSAKDKMINAIRAASIFISNLDINISPERTEEKQGFIHPLNIKGDVNEVSIKFILREFDKEKIIKLKKDIDDSLKKTLSIYPDFKYEVFWIDAYYNMKEVIEKNPIVMEKLIKSCKEIGIDPIIKGIRGGTDGARLSFMGLPCPNIFTGGYLYHSKYEFAVLEEMEKATELIITICNEFAH